MTKRIKATSKAETGSHATTALININKAHFMKTNTLVESKFASAITNCERLINTAYDHQLAPGALHHKVLASIVNHTNAIATNSEHFSFINKLADLSLVETS
jgi:hypothetical protein